MRHFHCYADDRNKDLCVHCGGAYETDDHVPSKVFLDEPFPDNLLVCSSCWKCNNAFSLDETYLACLLECVIAGEVTPSRLFRPKIGKVLARSELLLERLRRAESDGDAGSIWRVEHDRVKTVVLKLARGHAAYECARPQLQEPYRYDVRPLSAMSASERDVFEGTQTEIPAVWPEVGSRAMQRLLVVGSAVFNEGWIVVQDGNYRFHVSEENGLTVKIVLREYLACQVAWE